ncbi:MAG: flagellar brake protein [Lachnospiraceae bacterium]|nr:flagellar brake protein [Lachnospiraceae bacterium]
MLTNFVKAGQKIELQSVERMNSENEEQIRKVYVSKVYDVLSEDRLEVLMPMEKTKLILLPVDAEYNICFYTDQGLYQCFVRIIDRYKSNNVYILVLELISNLRRFQRREYYRFSCALEMESRDLLEEEKKAVEKEEYRLIPGLPLKRSVIVDLSGGGLRFVSVQKYANDSIIYITYHLMLNGQKKKYELLGRILSVNEVQGRPGTYEHRVQYINLDVDAREEIIKYIFEEERKHRHKESNR